MLISFLDIYEKYNMNITGVLHVGAHKCEELNDYLKKGIPKSKIIWVEANSEKCNYIKEKDSEIIIYNNLISDIDNKEYKFNIANNGESSSLLEFGTHSKNHPKIKFIDSKIMKSTRLDTLYKDNNISNNFANFLNFDIQGAELLALKGMGNLLYNFDYCYLEVNKEEVYKDCPIIDEIDFYLKKFNFIRVRHKFYKNEGWGDALYIKQNNIILDDKILVAVTTYNEIQITENCIKSLLNSNIKFDIIMIDDFSKKDNLKILSEKYKIPLISKVYHSGLTNSWNIAYKYFIDNNYDTLFLSNNDIIYPIQTIEYMVNKLYNSDCLIVVPSSTWVGAGIGCCQKLQGIKNIPNLNSDIDINNIDNLQEIQDFLIKWDIFREQYVSYFTGFLFGIKKEIKKYEFSDNILFNPKNINLCNEIDLYNRIKEKSNKNLVLHAKNAFVYHHKALTINIKKRDDLKQLENKYK